MRRIIGSDIRMSAGAVFAVVCLLSACAWGASAGGYQQPMGIVGGGGTIEGERYVMTATVGQAVAGLAGGERYEVIGGIKEGSLSACIVGFDDIVRFADVWLDTEADVSLGLVEDGRVDFRDYDVLAGRWLYWCPEGWALK